MKAFFFEEFPFRHFKQIQFCQTWILIALLNESLWASEALDYHGGW